MMHKSLSILSVQVPILGHKTYAKQMRKYFAASPAVNMESYWLDEDREWHGRLVRRLLNGIFPGSWAAKRNLDFCRFRREIGNAYLGRSLVQRKLKTQEYDLLHFHTQVACLLSGELMKNIPSIVSGDMTAVQVADENPEARYRFTYKPSIEAEKRVFTAAARIVLWSQWAADSVIHDYKIDPQKVKVVYPGVDLSVFPLIDRQSRKNDSVRLLFVGNDFIRKGGQDLLDAFQQKLSEHAELHIVTNAEVRCDHRKVFVHRGIQAYSPEWISLYQQSDIFVMPTRQEAFGLVFAEAMAASLPIVSTNINAIPEIVSNGHSGILIHPGDRQALVTSLSLLIHNMTMRCSMGRRGRQIATEKFDIEKNFNQLEAIFQKAVQDK